MDTKVDSNVALQNVVIDLEVYPRAEWSSTTVDRYAEALEAGERLPPIVLEQGSNLLLDGMHRYQAYLKLGLDSIEVDYDEVPEDLPTKLYAASLSTRHGDRIAGADLKEVARNAITLNPRFSQKTVAQLLGVTPKTISKWVADITQQRKAVRKVKALILSRSGRLQEEIAEDLGISQSVVNDDLSEIEHGNFPITENLLREASEDLPDEFTETIVAVREELIFATWNEEELALLHQLRHGKTIIVNMRSDGHPNLIEWCQDTGLFVKIDRRSEWGNPFEMPADGDRATVIENYEEHYLPYKPSLTDRLGELRGKALGCWCAPEPCHGDVLQRQAYMDAE